MPHLTDFGIAHRENVNEQVIGATPINENIAESILGVGINPDDVNKLVLPSGLGNVGHLTMLTPLLGSLGESIDWVEDILIDPVAVCGEAYFMLSRRYDVLTRFAPMLAGDGKKGPLTRSTLAVVRFYDIRSDFSIDSSFGVLPAGNADARANNYDNNWSLGTYWDDPDDPNNDPEFHQYGFKPIDVLRGLGIFPNPETKAVGLLPLPLEGSGIDQELNDPLNLREDTNKPSSVLRWADSILTNCGLVALPWTTPRGNENNSQTFYNDTGFMFRLAYIGDGASESCESWSSLSPFYSVGSLAVASGEIKNDLDLWSSGESSSIEDIESLIKWDLFPEGGIPPCVDDSWLGFPLDVSNGMHDRFTVAFPMKDFFTGEIGAVVLFMQHGIPVEYLRQGDYDGDLGYDIGGNLPSARNPFGVTDHLKTRWISGTEVIFLDPDHEDFEDYCQYGCFLGMDRDHLSPTVCESSADCEDGFACLHGICVFEGGGEAESCNDYCSSYETTGLERAPSLQELVARAMELSRRFYSRYYSGVGNVVWHLHHPIFPWAGCSTYEWGYKNDKPYTAAFGKIDNPLFGFNTPSIGSDLTVTGDLVAMSRPDGTLNLETIHRKTNAVLCQIVRVNNSFLGRPKYDIHILDGNMRAYALKALRVAGSNLFHRPAEVGSFCVLHIGDGFAFKPSEQQLNDFEENTTPYVLLAEEGLATASCREGLGAGGGISGFRGTRRQVAHFPDQHMLNLHNKIREIHGL